MDRLTLVVLAGALLLAAIIIFRRRREDVTMPPRRDVRAATPEDDDGIDWDELRRAEREVQELEDDGSGGAPEQSKGDDWGPGAARPPGTA